ncbi:hypothetical protein DV515_00005720 [Chloebia gouldiae]|uniref:Uncharacterized protein n=1 Tax=Chloebia gouldiae TaxID=44316 RepID=A0A3L8SN29_CHLGU|nr:hypothetical protein DV515_00005720 [Chloebia gouldiae]
MVPPLAPRSLTDSSSFSIPVGICGTARLMETQSLSGNIFPALLALRLMSLLCADLEWQHPLDWECSMLHAEKTLKSPKISPAGAEPR